MAISATTGTTNTTNAANTTGTTSTTASVLGSGSNAPSNAAETEDRFLRLLVAQMQNQDPMNPLDNAQVTTQMAQIQTVNGLETLNASVLGLNTQFSQLQAMSGAALVGRGVLVDGSRMDIVDGQGRGGFDLLTSADRVSVDVLDGTGRVIDTMQMGSQGPGRHSFDWTPPHGVDAARATSFRVNSTLLGEQVQNVPLAHDRVVAVSSYANGLVLELAAGATVPYEQVRVFD
jgi:flagellar basal-body rod modification protein FlgD